MYHFLASSPADRPFVRTQPLLDKLSRYVIGCGILPRYVCIRTTFVASNPSLSVISLAALVSVSFTSAFLYVINPTTTSTSYSTTPRSTWGYTAPRQKVLDSPLPLPFVLMTRSASLNSMLYMLNARQNLRTVNEEENIVRAQACLEVGLKEGGARVDTPTRLRRRATTIVQSHSG